MEKHHGNTVRLSERPGDAFYGGRFLQLPVRTMWGNGFTWGFMLTILLEPVRRAGHDGRVSHIIRKFQVPDYVLDLLESLLFVVGFWIKGDVLVI